MAQVDQSCLEKLKTFREEIDWKNKKWKRPQRLHRFFFLIDNCEGQLPNLRDIFQPREINWLVGLRDKEGQTLLHLALMHKNVEVAILLLRNGSDPNAANKIMWTPLHIICDWENNEKSAVFLKLFFDINDELNQRVKVNTQASSGRTALHLALKHKNTKVAESLLRRGANPNLTMKDGSTPLHMIFSFNKYFNNDDERATLLKIFFDVNDELHQTINVDVLDNQGRSPLLCAVEFRLKKTAASLLRRGANPNLTGKDGYTPLHMICIKRNGNDTERATFLKFFFDLNDEIHQLVKIDAVNKLNETPLLLALKNEDTQVAEVLLRRGANPNWANEDGKKLLHLICELYYDFKGAAFLKVFFEICAEKNQKVQVDARDKGGRTPLQLALSRGNEKTAALLLKNGADPNLADEEGSTPLHYICKNRHEDSVVELLKTCFEINDDQNRQVLIDARDKKGLTPLQLAVENLWPDVVDMLLDRGADLSSFIFPTGNHFDECFEPLLGWDWGARKLEQVARVLVVIERLEKRGYKLDLSNALTIMKVFDKYRLLKKSVDLTFLLGNEELMNIAKEWMIHPRLSLYDLFWIQPKNAEKLLSNVDFLELTRSAKIRIQRSSYRGMCMAQLSEMISRGFRRRWTMEFFLVLTRYQLPILCCEKIIDLLNNEDLLGICLAAEIFVEEETQ